jgi:hypothetical protein
MFKNRVFMLDKMGSERLSFRSRVLPIRTILLSLKLRVSRVGGAHSPVEASKDFHCFKIMISGFKLLLFWDNSEVSSPGLKRQLKVEIPKSTRKETRLWN